MLKIAICDDEQAIRAMIEEYLKRIGREAGIHMEINQYADGESLLFNLAADTHMVILDVEMPGMNGLVTAGEIRKSNREMMIVFATNYLQYAVDGYRVGAYRYLVKPLSFEQVEEELREELIRLQRKEEAVLNLKTDEGIYVLKQNRIEYIESMKHRLMIHYDQGILNCCKPISRIEEEMDEKQFFRCHKSFIINLAEVEVLSREGAVMKSGIEIPVSKYRKKAMTQALLDWIGEIL